ncbi:MAG: PA0069 family radical SAM protein [Phycisphaeraceae bacterium]
MAKWYDNPKGDSDVGEYCDGLLDAAHGVRGRGAGLNPGNRFESVRLHVLGEHLDQLMVEEPPESEAGRTVPTRIYRDKSKTIINSVQSPDIGFEWTLNPYRGCEHGCIYCYARPYHEYLGFSCGIDFETRIMAKPEAAAMLRRELASPRWKPETIVMSAITDCWQPIEAKLKIARACLEVLVECRQKVGVITKNRLILRDLDLLTELDRYHAVHASITLPTLDNKLAAKLEPRASAPTERLATIRALADAGIPVNVMIAPIIPAITDRETPAILQAVADAGAHSAAYVMLRLPYQIKALYEDWLQRHFPDRAEHALNLLRSMHHGKLYDSTPEHRGRGDGQIAEQIGRVFKVFQARYHLNRKSPPYDPTVFRRPSAAGQMALFA